MKHVKTIFLLISLSLISVCTLANELDTIANKNSPPENNALIADLAFVTSALKKCMENEDKIATEVQGYYQELKQTNLLNMYHETGLQIDDFRSHVQIAKQSDELRNITKENCSRLPPIFASLMSQLGSEPEWIRAMQKVELAGSKAAVYEFCDSHKSQRKTNDLHKEFESNPLFAVAFDNAELKVNQGSQSMRKRRCDMEIRNIKRLEPEF